MTVHRCDRPEPTELFARWVCPECDGLYVVLQGRPRGFLWLRRPLEWVRVSRSEAKS